jgi:hypothetical protein
LRVLIAVIACALACGAKGRLYPGEARPPGDVSFISAPRSDNLEIVRIDERRVRGPRWEVLPGNHIIEVEATFTATVNLPRTGQAQTMYFKTRCRISFQAQPRQTYVPRSSGGHSGAGQDFFTGDVSVWLSDANKRGSRVGRSECESSTSGMQL